MSAGSILSKCDLNGFIAYLENNGWTREMSIGEYEVLRMRKPGQEHPLLVYRTNKKPDYLTTFGISLNLCLDWFESRGDYGQST